MPISAERMNNQNRTLSAPARQNRLSPDYPAIQCAQCCQMFKPYLKSAKFCSPACANENYKLGRRRENNPICKTFNNLVPACARCNAAKSDRDWSNRLRLGTPETAEEIATQRRNERKATA